VESEASEPEMEPDEQANLLVDLRNGLIALHGGAEEGVRLPEDAPSTDPDLVALLVELARVGGTELHLTAGRPPTCRIDGALKRLDLGSLTSAAITALLPAKERQRIEAERDVDISLSISGVGRFRCHAFPQRGSVSVVIVAVPPAPPGPTALGLPASLAAIGRLERGLVVYGAETPALVASGLAALVSVINTQRPVHVITIEKPISYLHRHAEAIVNQREVPDDVPSIAAGAELSLRLYPDVLMLSDLPDAATARAAALGAEQGCLVLAGLPRADAASLSARFEAFWRDTVASGLLRRLSVLVADHRGSGSPTASVLVVDDQMRSSPYHLPDMSGWDGA